MKAKSMFLSGKTLWGGTGKKDLISMLHRGFSYSEFRGVG